MAVRVSRYLRRMVLERDHYICQKCGCKVLNEEERSRVPHVHHLDHGLDSNQGGDDLENLTTYCAGCHTSMPKRFVRRGVSLLTAVFEEEFLSPRELCRVLDVSRKTVIRWIRSGYVKAITTPGGHYKVSQKEAERLWRLLSGRTDNP